MSEFIRPPVAAFLSASKGCIEIRRTDSGGYATDEAVELATAMVEAGEPVSQWAVWDARPNAPKERRTRPYSAAEFRKLLSGQDVAIVWCKRGTFRSPVLKVGEIDSRPAAPKGKRQTSTRIGR